MRLPRPPVSFRPPDSSPRAKALPRHRVPVQPDWHPDAVDRERAAEAHAVGVWWHMCERRGYIFPDAAVEGQDYTGALPWPREVGSRAVYAAFCAEFPHGVHMSKTMFIVHWRRVARIEGYRIGQVTVNDSRGRPISRYNETFYSVEHLAPLSQEGT